ncbi:MAG: DUF1731 domain-containing protein [Polyangiaceae bacterium]|nr:DUF1731 domain-containing protein [Polyangiaceae bacterium]
MTRAGDDLVRVALKRTCSDGTVAVEPNPQSLLCRLVTAVPEAATDRESTRALGAAVRRPACLHAPAVVLRVAFDDLAGILTASLRVIPQVALGARYRFAQGRLAGALSIVANSSRGAATHDSNNRLVPPS